MIQRLFGVVFLVLVTARGARACTCLPAPPPLKAFAGAEAVFRGRVTGIAQKPTYAPQIDRMVQGYEVSVEVTQSWKGGVAGAGKVDTGSGLGDCGFEFRKGDSYLIYAVRTPAGHWYTNACTRTKSVKRVGEEILELEGKLPIPKVAAGNPVFELKGRINDAGYNGYVFTLRNRLHERMFYLNFPLPGWLIQVQVGGKWVDYPPNNGLGEPGELALDAASERLAEWRKMYEAEDVKEAAWYLDRLSTTRIFVAPPISKGVWRVGMQYVTERELDSGARVQDSKHYFWSDPITAASPAKSLTFKEAFQSE